MVKKLLLLIVLLALTAGGCAVTEEKLLSQAERNVQKAKSYYAECEAVVFSMEGEQRYQIKQWQQAPSRWRVEVTAGNESQYFICDGSHIWVYQPGFADYYRIDAKQSGGELAPPFMLTGFLEQLQKAPSREFDGLQDCDGKKYYHVSYPGPLPGETVSLLIDPQTFFPHMAEITLDGKTVSRLLVYRLQLNPRLEDRLFEFTASSAQATSALCEILPLTLEEAQKGWPAPVYLPGYLPEGTSLYTLSRVLEETKEQLICIYQGSTAFTLVQSYDKTVPVIKNSKAYPVQIGEYTGSFQNNSTNDLAVLCWSGKDCSFIITGTLSESEMIKIALSLQPADL